MYWDLTEELYHNLQELDDIKTKYPLAAGLVY
jgi:hypothetical protein